MAVGERRFLGVIWRWDKRRMGERLQGATVESELKRGWPVLTGNLLGLPDDLGLDRGLAIIIWI